MGIPNTVTASTLGTAVSIAGGDSWVGIPCDIGFSFASGGWFQSQVAILGWGYDNGRAVIVQHIEFQSQVAILGWGYCIAAGPL